MACLVKISSAIDTMTAGERKVADYVLKDPERVVHSSAKQLADACDSSPASVVRFARMLGYEGFNEMKEALRAELADADSFSQQITIDFDDDLPTIADCVVAKLHRGMRTVLALQDDKNLQRAIEAINRAETVYLYGVGASGLAAEDMQQKFVRVNKRVIYRNDKDLGLLDSLYMTPKDAVIAISYSGRTREVILPAQNAVERGATCIAITKFGRTALNAIATLTLPLPENEPDLRHAAVQSKYASLLLVDLLFLGYIQRYRAAVGEKFIVTRTMINEFKSGAKPR